MNATLPHGLITVGHTNVSGDGHLHKADALFQRLSILHSFWKVHTIRYRVSKDPSDLRCENLFWRTWGNSTLSREITTAALTVLWSACQQQVDLAALQNVHKSRLLSSKRKHHQATYGEQHSLVVREQVDDLPQNPSPSPDPRSEQYTHGAQSSSDKGTSLGDEFSLTIANNGGSRRSSKTSRPTINRTTSSSTRTPLGTLVGKAKSRPSMSRRKSSQNSSQVKSARSSRVAMKSPTLALEEVDKQEVSPSIMVSNAFALPPASSWEDEPTASANPIATSPSYTDISSELVDSNFRNKFAERIASSSNLAGMSRLKKTGSVVRFADDVPTNLYSTKDDLSKSIPDHERRPSLAHRTSSASMASVAVINEDEAFVTELPRTKSQLSIMIQDSRSRYEQSTFEAAKVSNDHHGLYSRRRRALTDDEKILAMAHAEGVTKAGGRKVRKGFTFSDGEEQRFSSPSPPPLF